MSSVPRLPTRALAVVLAVQFLLGGVIVWGAATHFRFLSGITGPGGSGGSAASASAFVPPPRTNRFDAARAMAWARRQVDLGPRPAGSTAQREAAAFLRAALPGGHFQPIGGGLRNIVGELPGRGAPVEVVAHYDTTPVPGYLGANNSAAGVGAVLELARDLKGERAPRGARPVRFLLTDGEEAPTYPPQGNFLDEGLRGSRFAAAHPPRAADVIVLDFIAQRGIRLPREQGSNARLWGRLRTAAGRVGTLAVFPNETIGPIYDDHTPFAQRGVRAIDLIDWDYPCWQKTCDRMDKLSARSLDAVGETVLELVRELRTS